MSSRLTLSLALPLMMIVIGVGVLCLGVTLVTTVATTLRSA